MFVRWRGNLSWIPCDAWFELVCCRCLLPLLLVLSLLGNDESRDGVMAGETAVMKEGKRV